MINVRAIYLGNEAEAYILDDFIDGINIINSDDNHVGKTIVMQSIMFAMGSEAMFPHNFKLSIAASSGGDSAMRQCANPLAIGARLRRQSGWESFCSQPFFELSVARLPRSSR